MYFAKPRQLRALMTAQVVGEGMIAAMRAYDMMKEREANRKSKRR